MSDDESILGFGDGIDFSVNSDDDQVTLYNSEDDEVAPLTGRDNVDASLSSDDEVDPFLFDSMDLTSIGRVSFLQKAVLCSRVTLGYIMGRGPPLVANMGHLPPPYDRHPDFPLVLFNLDDEPQLDLPAGVINTVICHIVPGSANAYVTRHGGSYHRPWSEPEDVLFRVMLWHDLGFDVTVYPRLPGVQVMGAGYQMSRFVCGGGLALYVVWEVGMLPPEAEVGGVQVGGMVAVYGTSFPSPGGDTLAYHILPAEYLVGSDRDGISAGSTRLGGSRWPDSPPLFSSSTLVDVETGLAFSRVDYVVGRWGGQGGAVVGVDFFY